MLRETRDLLNLEDVRIAILAEHEYEDLDLWYPYLRLQEAGAEVFIVGTGSSDIYVSKRGARITVDADADMVYAEQFDAIIIPGGWAADRLRRNEAVLRLVREANQDGKLVAAVGHGGWVLVSAQLLRGRTVTGGSGIRDDLVNAGAEYVDTDVVRDGNLVTSRNQTDLPAFGREVVAALHEVREASLDPLFAGR